MGTGVEAEVACMVHQHAGATHGDDVVGCEVVSVRGCCADHRGTVAVADDGIAREGGPTWEARILFS